MLTVLWNVFQLPSLRSLLNCMLWHFFLVCLVPTQRSKTVQSWDLSSCPTWNISNFMWTWSSPMRNSTIWWSKLCSDVPKEAPWGQKCVSFLKSWDFFVQCYTTPLIILLLSVAPVKDGWGGKHVGLWLFWSLWALSFLEKMERYLSLTPKTLVLSATEAAPLGYSAL